MCGERHTRMLGFMSLISLQSSSYQYFLYDSVLGPSLMFPFICLSLWLSIFSFSWSLLNIYWSQVEHHNLHCFQAVVSKIVPSIPQCSNLFYSLNLYIFPMKLSSFRFIFQQRTLYGFQAQKISIGKEEWMLNRV